MYNLNKWQKASLIALRVIIGWHFLHEGIIKLLNKSWSSSSYLSEAKWILSGLFHEIAENPKWIKVVDFLNIWGLIFIGTSLIIGLFSRMALIAGMLLLLIYYLGTIPLPGLDYNFPTEGNYLIVNKILIELVALLVLFFFPTSKYLGFDKLIFKN